MATIQDIIRSSQRVVPMIYAYTTPGIFYHEGWTKIGYTEQDVSMRIKQQTQTADIVAHEEWRGKAEYDDGSGDTFRDTHFHAYLEKNGIARKDPQEDAEGRPEWFQISGDESHKMFNDFRSNRGLLANLGVTEYKLRKEQANAVEQMKAYMESHENDKPECLWNAKPRFGKTLSAYDLCKQLEANKVLIVTNRPAIANSWYEDYAKFLGTESGYRFISSTDSLKGKPLVVSYDEFVQEMMTSKTPYKRIEFVSLQDLKGAIDFGGSYRKLEEVAEVEWDLLIIDEAHEGVDTYKTDIAFDHIKRKYTLHLSGTPFKALANAKFPEDAIFNWTYADEQAAKHAWPEDSEELNPYADLPQLNMLTYQMSEIVKDEINQGIEIDGEVEEYAFDLNEFFATDDRGAFIHGEAVDKFLDALTTQEKYPFSTPKLREELKHTFWILNRVASARALAKKLEKHPLFSDYKVILAAGDGKIDDEDENQKSYDKVVDAISKYDKTITLSVGQLTTGITIPEWTAVLMLSNMQSPALYMQAAFRAQNPCLFQKGTEHYRKENAYVFDFDPARTLTIFEEFANDLSGDTAAGRGDSDTRKQNVRRLLNFFPVIGEDENGEMVELDAEKVLSIPRKIRSQEVVRRGFMSNFLFQNISNIFGAPEVARNIINKFEPVKEPVVKVPTPEQLSLNEDGEVEVANEYVISKTEALFGEKIYEDIAQSIKENTEIVEAQGPDQQRQEIEKIKKMLCERAIKPFIEKSEEEYGTSELTPSTKKRLEKQLTAKADQAIEKAYGNFNIEQKKLEVELQDSLDKATSSEEMDDIANQFEQKQLELVETLQQSLVDVGSNFAKEAGKDIVKTVEESKKQKEKKTAEDAIRDHLRGFSRTIPSFLMAYGSDEVTLASFDQIIPSEVFLEVTSITLDEFRFLRDGGDYPDEETGETKHFDGHLFDEVVFDDSVKEFLKLKEKLANYFDESIKEDIFDYIPPQKTNQIYTPKKVVKQMVDYLEEENPGCFDDSSKTFMDLYMKSGLYITEIVTRLFNSEALIKEFPDEEERLGHIFSKQVYGLAPTEIIYRIATNFILGFSDDVDISQHNFRKLDALPFAKNGTLSEELDKLYGTQPDTQERKVVKVRIRRAN